jgi:hypothetical protein
MAASPWASTRRPGNKGLETSLLSAGWGTRFAGFIDAGANRTTSARAQTGR